MVEESYDSIKESFSDLIKDVDMISKSGSIIANQREIKVKLLLGGDYKVIYSTH